MFYQEALPKFGDFFLYPVSIACLQLEIDTAKISRYIRKRQISKLTSICAIIYGAYFCMGFYKRDVFFTT